MRRSAVIKLVLLPVLASASLAGAQELPLEPQPVAQGCPEGQRCDDRAWDPGYSVHSTPLHFFSGRVARGGFGHHGGGGG